MHSSLNTTRNELIYLYNNFQKMTTPKQIRSLQIWRIRKLCRNLKAIEFLSKEF